MHIIAVETCSTIVDVEMCPKNDFVVKKANSWCWSDLKECQPPPKMCHTESVYLKL